MNQAWKHFQQKRVEELFDPNLAVNDSNTRGEVTRVVHIGLLCTQEVPSLRPSMSEALRMLVNKEEKLAAPTTPPFMDDDTMELTSSSPLNYSNGDVSVSGISHSIFYPR